MVRNNILKAGKWHLVQPADRGCDGDGAEDIIAGNIGQNSPVQVSEKNRYFITDFDNNGSIDPFLDIYIGE